MDNIDQHHKVYSLWSLLLQDLGYKFLLDTTNDFKILLDRNYPKGTM